jgi:uncharacterized membrane protein (DUF485 family)
VEGNGDRGAPARGDLTSAAPATGLDASRDAAVAHEIRVRLWASAVLLVAVMILPVLTSFTSVLNGFVGGVGIAYVVGFAEFVVALGAALVYCRWADRRAADRGRAAR